MKEIKAYIRPEVADRVIHALESLGAKSMTIIPVQAIGELSDARHSHMSTLYIKPYSQIFKLELICRDEDLDRLVSAIRGQAHTGEAGDGIISVYAVERAVKIRTGEEDAAALDDLGLRSAPGRQGGERR